MTKDDKPVMSFGVMGGAIQPQVREATKTDHRLLV